MTPNQPYKQQWTLSAAGVLRHFYHRLIANYLVRSGKVSSVGSWSEPIILRYERVVSPELISFPLAGSRFVRPQTLRLHLRYLRQHCDVLTLEETLHLASRKAPLERPVVALTFDGGWVETKEVIFPLLKEFNLPATVFLPTAFIGSMNIFWQDKFIAALMALREFKRPMPKFSVLDEKLTAELALIGGNPEEITLEKSSALLHALSVTPAEFRLLTLRELGAEIDAIGGLPLERTFLNWDEVRELNALGLMFGSLSHSHNNYAELTPDEMGEDLYRSFSIFKEQNVEPSRVFAFPLGVVAEEAPAMLAELNFRYALTQQPFVMQANQNEATIVGRLPMFESVAYCKELFTCRLMQARFLGEQY